MIAQDIPSQSDLTTGSAVRLACRSGRLTSFTSGLAPGYLQANLIVLPSRYANDFRILCHRNPVPCPLLAETTTAGDFSTLKSWISGIPAIKLANDLDLRHDFPKYAIYQDGILSKSDLPHAADHWTDDHIAFILGCSYSFETALAKRGLVPPHVKHGRNVPMYRTTIPLLPAGDFQNATYVVSMRLYKDVDIERVRSITRPFTATHGEPIAWGWDGARRIGVGNICQPDWGDAPVCEDGRLLEDLLAAENGDDVGGDYVPVFWGCGVTPQHAVMQANIEGTVIAHAPGHMLLLDITDEDILPDTKKIE